MATNQYPFRLPLRLCTGNPPHKNQVPGGSGGWLRNSEDHFFFFVKSDILTVLHDLNPFEQFFLNFEDFFVKYYRPGLYPKTGKTGFGRGPHTSEVNQRHQKFSKPSGNGFPSRYLLIAGSDNFF